MDHVMGYVAAGSEVEAACIAKALLKAKLAACVNIVNDVRSLYMWEGKLKESSECLLIAKANRSTMERFVEVVKKYHSYENPCVVFLPIIGGSGEYLRWANGQISHGG